jgi:serpin B
MKIISLFCFACCLSLTSLAAGEIPVAGNTAFALELYGQLRSETGNVFISPYSISTALAMTYSGARENTEAQMAKTMHFAQPQGDFHKSYESLQKRITGAQVTDQFEFLEANSLWPQTSKKFKDEFMTICKTQYGAGVIPVDYLNNPEAARQAINQWVEAKTKQYIKELLPEGSVDSSTKMTLVNAVYFKGKWMNCFKKEHTSQREDFHVTPAKTEKVPMMYASGERQVAQLPDLQILAMPYKGGNATMLVLLPVRQDGLADLEQKLTPKNLQTWISALKNEPLVEVYMPKFSIEAQFGLHKTLAGMGMPDAFSPSRADFSGMDGERDLFISQIIHKAILKVDEEGTVAAAATAVIKNYTSAMEEDPVKPVIFRADHPFLVVIRENSTDSILFLGRLTNPPPAAKK